MPGWLDNAFHSHQKRELVALAVDGLLSRAISRCGDLLTDGFVEESWVAKQLLDGMLRPKQRELVIELALAHRVFERLAAGETRELVGVARAGLRGCAIRVLLGPFPVDGYVVHDYLDCNRSREETEAIRERDAAKKRGQRSKKRQEQLPWSRFEHGSQGATPSSPGAAPSSPVSPGESPLKAGDSGDRGVELPPTIEDFDVDARAGERAGAGDPDPVVAEVLAILAEVPRLRVDEIAVRNAIRAFPGGDAVLAAREIVATVGSDPTRWLTWASSLLWKALERQSAQVAPAAPSFGAPRRGRGPTAADFQRLKGGVA